MNIRTVWRVRKLARRVQIVRIFLKEEGRLTVGIVPHFDGVRCEIAADAIDAAHRECVAVSGGNDMRLRRGDDVIGTLPTSSAYDCKTRVANRSEPVQRLQRASGMTPLSLGSTLGSIGRIYGIGPSPQPWLNQPISGLVETANCVQPLSETLSGKTRE